MMDQLITWALQNRALVLAAAALVTAFGLITATRMPVDVFPDLTAPTVTILTEAHGMAPTEVESQVTTPLESAMNGAQQVRRVRSSTAVGLSIVWVEFDWGTDLAAARQTVTERLAAATDGLPSEVERPTLAPASSIMGEVMFLGLTSETESPGRLREIAGNIVRRRLLSVPGVAQVTTMGGGERQFQVVINPASLAAYQLRLRDVMQALVDGNENVSAGVINQYGQEWLVTGEGRIHALADISETVVTVRQGVPVRIGDFATVRIGEAPRRGEGSLNGQPAVIFSITKQPGANTLALTRQLDSVVADLQSKLPPGVKLHPNVFRQADFIEVAVRNVERALAEGVALVIVVVLLFLANARATFITVTAIPLSLLVAVLTLQLLGATINTMTLGGMAIAIGALVDDAVIDVENVFRRLRENAVKPPGEQRPGLAVVLAASLEIRGSIVFATLIIALVFVPIFCLSGVEGRLLRPLGTAYLVALLASLLVAITVTPVLCSLLLPRARAVQAGHEPALVRRLKSAYARLLTPALDHPWAFTLPAVALFIAAIVGTAFLGRTFLPPFNEGTLTISAVTLPGTSLPESDELGRRLEQTLLTHPEVISVARRTGRAEQDEHAQGVESAELEVALHPFRPGRRSHAEFLADLRRSLSVVPGLNLTIGQPISHRIDHMLSGTRANLAVKIFGPDLQRLRDLAGKARDALADVPGVVDLSVEQLADVPILRVHFDRPALARHGLTVRDVAQTMEAAVQGAKVTTIIEGVHVHDLVVRLGDQVSIGRSPGKEESALLGLLNTSAPSGPPEPNFVNAPGWTVETLGDVPVDTPGGARIPLRALGEIVRDTGPNSISREQVERKIVVSCNVAGRDIASVVRDGQARIEPLFTRAPGYRVEFGGQFESAQQANQTLLLVGAAVIIGIGFLLHLAFRSARDAALIMLNLPLALIGAVAAVFLTGGVLSVASLIGFITVFGIATRNGIMLVSHIRHLQEHEGVTNFRDAVTRGAVERLVPILMTALAAGLALIPLALGGGQAGNEIQTPMAIVILGGLLTSMILNMIIVPGLYLRFGRPIRPIRPPAGPDADPSSGSAPGAVLRALVAFAVLLPAAGLAAPNDPERQSFPALTLTLQSAIDLAERRHPDLAEGRALADAARARTGQEAARPDPEIVARVESAPFRGRTAREAEYLAGVEQTVPLGPRLARAREAGAIEQERQRFELEARRREVHRRVHSTFATALYQDRAFLAQSNLAATADRLVTVTRTRQNAGDALVADVARAEMEQARVRLERDRAERLRVQAGAELAAAIGDVNLALPPLAGRLEDAFAIPTLESVAGHPTNHPAHAAAEADVRAWNARLEQARAERIPDLKISLLYRRLEGERRNAFDAGLSLPFPMFGRTTHRRDEAHALAVAADARGQSVQNDLALRWREASVQLGLALESRRSLERELLPRAEAILRSAEGRYAAGDLSLTEVLAARRDRAAIELGYLDSLRDALQAWADLQPFITRPSRPTPP